jgi:hypothetical protein
MSSRTTRWGGGGRLDHDERRQRHVHDLRAHTTGGGETGKNEKVEQLGSQIGLGLGGGDRRREIRRRRWQRAGKRRRAHGSLLIPRAGAAVFLFSRWPGTKTSERAGRPDVSISE